MLYQSDVTRFAEGRAQRISAGSGEGRRGVPRGVHAAMQNRCES
jgi:hypothetical protein